VQTTIKVSAVLIVMLMVGWLIGRALSVPIEEPSAAQASDPIEAAQLNLGDAPSAWREQLRSASYDLRRAVEVYASCHAYRSNSSFANETAYAWLLAQLEENLWREIAAWPQRRANKAWVAWKMIESDCDDFVQALRGRGLEAA